MSVVHPWNKLCQHTCVVEVAPARFLVEGRCHALGDTWVRENQVYAVRPSTFVFSGMERKWPPAAPSHCIHCPSCHSENYGTNRASCSFIV